jgi:hypothetical protein
MVETLMALWNRGISGRLVVTAITFCCICISISLLFVTVGSAWGSLLAHGRGSDEGARMVDSTLITATAPGSVSTAPVTVTPVITPHPCVASPTSVNGRTARGDGTREGGKTSVPSTHRISATPTHRRKTPTPGVSATPKPSPTPSPTLPAVTPTVVATPTPGATPLPTITPTVISTPTDTPTVGITPTGTTTPGATPTGIPTTGIVPTDTTTPNVTPTTTVTATTTPTATVPVGSPTAMTSATTGTGDTGHVSNGGSVMSGSSSSGDSNTQNGGNCLSNSLAASGEGAVLSLLQSFLWIILVSSLAGTALFCAQMYRVAHRKRDS